MTTYHIRTPVYEGPLELLLALIEKRKLLINDIALAEVADDFLKYLEQHHEFPVAETAQFVLVGSTLLLIKSKSLLPVLSLTDEEQGSIEDLEVRLKLLEQYQLLGRAVVSERFGKERLWGRHHSQKRAPVFSPDGSMTVANLHAAMQQVLAHLPKAGPKLAEATVRKVVSLEDMMTRLTERISASLQVSFREFSEGAEGRVNVIVSFLAMLELVRQGVVRVEQESQYGDIRIEADRVGVPRYG